MRRRCCPPQGIQSPHRRQLASPYQAERSGRFRVIVVGLRERASFPAGDEYTGRDAGESSDPDYENAAHYHAGIAQGRNEISDHESRRACDYSSRDRDYYGHNVSSVYPHRRTYYEAGRDSHCQAHRPAHEDGEQRPQGFGVSALNRQVQLDVVGEESHDA